MKNPFLIGKQIHLRPIEEDDYRISLLAFEYNSRALNVYNKIGFVKEGTLREAHFQVGKYHDIMVMSLLRKEWAANADL